MSRGRSRLLPATLPAIVLAALGTSSCSTASGHATPATVNATLQELAAQCTDANGTPHTGDAVRRADLNSDGNDDFVVYAGWIDCENAWSIYGDREKIVSVFAGDGRGAARSIFSDLVYDARIGSADHASQLWLTVAAEACGRTKAQNFADETFCERAIQWNAASSRFEYTQASTVRVIR